MIDSLVNFVTNLSAPYVVAVLGLVVAGLALLFGMMMAYMSISANRGRKE